MKALIALGTLGALFCTTRRSGSATHLKAGQSVMLSDEGLDKFRNWRGEVVSVRPDSYYVMTAHRDGAAEYGTLPDRHLVAAGSDTREWPGTDYDGALDPDDEVSLTAPSLGSWNQYLRLDHRQLVAKVNQLNQSRRRRGVAIFPLHTIRFDRGRPVRAPVSRQTLISYLRGGTR